MRAAHRFMAAVLSVLLMLVMRAPALSFYYDEGNDGNSEETAYVIDSLEEFIRFRDRVNDGTDGEGKYYRLEADIDYSRSLIQDYGKIGTGTHPFKGHFDGNGKTIHIVNEVDDSINAGSDLSLFGVIESTGTAIKNLNITGSIIIASENLDNMSASGLAYYLNSGIIENCTFTGTVGALSQTENCYAAGLVYYVAGYGTIRGCTFSGTVSAYASHYTDYATTMAGGIALSCSGVIENCTVLHGSTVSANSYYSYAGGIVAGFSYLNASYSRLSGCTSNASIENAFYKGGLIGRLHNDEIPDDIDSKVFNNAFTGAEYAIGRPQANLSENPIYTFNGHTYRLFTESLTWQEAKAKCESMGGYLATITTPEEDAFIAGLLSSDITQRGGGVWLGAYGSSSSTWQWVTSEAMSFTSWIRGQPDYSERGHELYGLHVWHNSGGWADYGSGLTTQGYVCEWGDYTPDAGSLSLYTVSGHGENSIISYIDAFAYRLHDGSAIDERYLFMYPNTIYDMKGFATDGNARLFLIAQTNEPGLVTFSIPSLTGVKLENLSRDHWSTRSITIPTTEIREGLHQASAALIAPEAWPFELSYPSDTITLTASFMSDEGAVTSTDKRLTVTAPPVVVIHGIWGEAYSSFGLPNNHGFTDGAGNPIAVTLTGDGIGKKLRDTGLKAYGCNYTNIMGPSDIIPEGSTNSDIYKQIAAAITSIDKSGIACTRADLIVHSMGGLMARRFIEIESYKSSIAYKEGMVRRLITVDTPHEGSPWPSYILGDYDHYIYSYFNDILEQIPIRGTLNFFKWTDNPTESNVNERRVIGLLTSHYAPELVSNHMRVVLAYESLKNDTDKSALRDLALNSKLLRNLQGLSVPIHAIYGLIKDDIDSLRVSMLTEVYPLLEGGKQMIADMKYGKIKSWYMAALFEAIPELFESKELCEALFNVMFDGEDYDLAVSKSSQISRFGGAATGFPVSPSGSWAVQYYHNGIAHQDDVGERVIELLKGPISNFVTLAPETSAAPRSYPITYESTESSADLFPETLTLSSSINALTSPGDVTFTVTAGESLDNPVYLMLTEEDGVRFIRLTSSDERNFACTLTFSGDVFGAMNASCFSRGSDDNIHTSNTVELTVKPQAEVVSIAFLNELGTIYANVGSEIATGLQALTSDGRVFSISSPLMGTSYTAEDPAVAGVTDSGYIIGLAEGSTRLTATYGTLSASISVDVTAIAQTPDSDDSVAPAITTSTLSAGRVGTSYRASITASGTEPLSWSITSGRLPDGLTLNRDSGIIAGTPKASGRFTFSVTVSNTAGSAVRTFTLTIRAESTPAPDPTPSPTPTPEPSPDVPTPSPSPEPTPTPSPSPTPEPEPEPTPTPSPSPSPTPEPEPDTEPVILIGQARSISDLTQSELAVTSSDSRIIAAVLPQAQARITGTYYFNAEIYPHVPIGASIFWNGFPQNATYDDSHAEFLDEQGVNISSVPSSRRVRVAANLEAGTLYAPIITASRPASQTPIPAPAPQPDDPDERPESRTGGSGGGCELSALGLMMMCLLAKKIIMR